MIACPHCGEAASEYTVFCNQCGQRLKAARHETQAIASGVAAPTPEPPANPPPHRATPADPSPPARRVTEPGGLPYGRTTQPHEPARPVVDTDVDALGPPGRPVDDSTDEMALSRFDGPPLGAFAEPPLGAFAEPPPHATPASWDAPATSSAAPPPPADQPAPTPFAPAPPPVAVHPPALPPAIPTSAAPLLPSLPLRRRRSTGASVALIALWVAALAATATAVGLYI